MNRILRVFLTILWCGLFLAELPANPQSLKLKWSKQFSKSVSWYARTSAGIIVAMVGQNLVAMDEVEGRQLWMLPQINRTGKWKGSLEASAMRGQDTVEVQGMGVLLLNHAKLQGDQDGRLIAINLTSGKRLWDQPEADELMTAVPLYASGDAVLVSRRRQTKVFAAEEAVVLASGLPFAVYYPVPYPYRFELARIALDTGKTKWNMEYERTFTPGTVVVRALGERLFIYFANRVMTCMDLADGKFLWEDGKKFRGTSHSALPIELIEGKLIYSSEYVRAVDPATQKELWSVEELGSVSGLQFGNGRLFALGDRAIAAVDLSSGKELWRNKTHGHTTNLLWDQASDALLYIDGKGLHSMEAGSGKTRLDTPLHVESWPSQIRLASPEVVVTMAVKEVCAYNFKTGNKLFSEGKLVAFFRSNAALDNWPMPESGEAFDEMSRMPSNEAEWQGLRKNSLLTAEVVKLLEKEAAKGESLEAFETEIETETGGVNSTQRATRKVWWIGLDTNRKMELSPSGELHEVDRRTGMVYAVNGLGLWGAAIVGEEKTQTRSVK